MTLPSGQVYDFKNAARLFFVSVDFSFTTNFPFSASQPSPPRTIRPRTGHEPGFSRKYLPLPLPFFLFLPSTLHGLDNLPPDMTGGRRSTLQQQHGYHRVSLMSCLNPGFFAGGSASNDSYISTRPHFLSLNSLSLESFHFLRRNSTLNEAGPTKHQRQTGKQGGLWNLSKH